MSFLDQVLATTRRQLAQRDDADAPSAVVVRDPTRFPEALRGRRRLSVIAEIKRRSPSRGRLAACPSPAEQARRYAAGGAAAISVLTRAEGFGGSLDDLREVRATVDLPLLMKDFILDEVQLRDAADSGADAVLLMVRCLPGKRLAELLAACEALGLAALVEAHDAAELRRALDVGADIVGVNNRDLATLEVDRSNALDLLPALPTGVIGIAESGYGSAADLVGLPGRCDAVLVGSALMTADDPAALLEEMTSCE
ncbi:MAG: indole-3-glycerol-phosphate synthase [Acidobacteriota bacterium]